MCATCGCGKPGVKHKKAMSPKQEKIAGKAAPKDKITGADFKAMKSSKGKKQSMPRKKGM